MKLSVQKKIASKLLKCSLKRVKISPDRLSDVSKAITRNDMSDLVNQGIVVKAPVKGVSRVRANHKAKQKRKGLQKGPGKHKGKITSRTPSKEAWMTKIRLLRTFLKELKEKELLNAENYKNLYRKSKGGFFRNKRHMKIYIDEHNLVRKG
ncbi:MAG: 50S ribosomal protein L19e [Candidatus Nanoarchaeia archaeon]|nr:50S ribosomal protein L19e [Candidatus Nanoarchaeia archaeon]